MKWISVKDRLPQRDDTWNGKQGDMMLLLNDETILMGTLVGTVFWAYFTEGFGKVRDSKREVTHWQPLPELLNSTE